MSVATMQWEAQRLVPGLRDALRSLMTSGSQGLWQAPDADLAVGLAAIGRARALLEAAELAIVREGISRGVPTQESWSDADWVAVSEGRYAPRPPVGQVASVVRVARAGVGSSLSEPVGADAAVLPVAEVAPDEGGFAGPAGVAGVIAEVETGCLSVGRADQLVRFHRGVERVADPDLLEVDLQTLLAAAKDDVVTDPDGLVVGRHSGMGERELARAITQTTRMLRPAKEVESDDERARSARSLTSYTDECGMTRYKMVLDPEGAAIIDAAVAGLSKPVKGPDGERDERTPARRRADALVTIVGRGVSSPGDVGTSDKAQVMVTISMASLLTRGDGSCGVCGGPGLGALGAVGPGWLAGAGSTDSAGPGVGLGAGGIAGGGHAGGITATGAVLAPSAVRKLACEAGIIPVMLGSEGQPLDLGRATRFFTPGQKRLLWLRDGGCTFPGCTMPAHWTDAHHVQYWSLGGPTDIGNAALLCERHHTRVHTQDLTCTITDHGVTWHL